MRVPAHGYSFEQICHEAIKQGVMIVIGCHKTDVGAHPPVITVQVQDASGTKDPISFRTELHMADPRQNQKLCYLLMQKVEQMRPNRLKLIAP